MRVHTTYDFANTRQAGKTKSEVVQARAERHSSPSCRSLHHHLSLPLTKRIGETVPVVRSKDVIKEWLPSIFVYPLCDLVTGSITETWK